MNPCGWLSTAGLLCAAAGAGDSVPSGAMADYLVHCDEWAPTDSVAACAALADRLEAAEDPSPDERLALLLIRRESLTRAQGCGDLEAVSADHPDYADVLRYLALYGCGGGKSQSVALLRRAAELEPDNHHVLGSLLRELEGFPPEHMMLAPMIEAAGFVVPGRVSGIDPSVLAGYRDAYYESAKAYAAWWHAAAEDAVPDDPRHDPHAVADWGWRGLIIAARRIRAAALRDGDLRAAEAVQARLRRDMRLAELDYGAKDAPRSLARACKPVLYEALGMAEDCVAGIERLARRASADGMPLPGHVLEAVARTTDGLRRAACDASRGLPPYTRVGRGPGECEGAGATETAAVARLRAVLEHHGGAWSSEHHRVHAQGFLGDDVRRDGLRAALRADPGNALARCDLARALSEDDPEAAADVLGEGGDPSCLERARVWGDTFRR